MRRPVDPALRALNANLVFWLAMFMASALGTNLGDVWADEVGLQHMTSFGIPVVLCGAVIWADRRFAARTEVFYWLAIIGLRMGATNLGDLLTHDLSLSYPLVALALGALTLLAARFTQVRAGSDSPLVDGWYWVAMLLAGVFGTVGGDLAAHTIGIYGALALLAVALLSILVARRRYFPTAVLGYWCVVLAERCAATPAGDALASRHAAALGLPLAVASTASLFGAALLWRWRSEAARQLTVHAGCSATAALRPLIVAWESYLER